MVEIEVSVQAQNNSGMEADAIYCGGDIVTVNDAQPTAEAVAIKGGKIVGVGDRIEVEQRWQGKSTKVVDLEDRALLPGFIDAHSHLWLTGFQSKAANLLPEPDGTVQNIPMLQTKLREFSVDPSAKKWNWIVGFGYDDSMLEPNRIHPTHRDLDEVSTEIPVFAIHQSNHFGSLNSKGLQLMGIDENTPDPGGGKIRRWEDGTPNGVLEEAAFFMVLDRVLGSPEFIDDSVEIALAGVNSLAKFGFTTAQEGGANPALISLLRDLAKSVPLKIDVVAYPILTDTREDASAPPVSAWPSYLNGFRVGGVKFLLDGSPQGRTAWLTKPYLTPPDGQDENYRGYPSMPDVMAYALVDKAYERGWQVLAHTNGDAAADQYLEAIRRATEKHGDHHNTVERRSVAIHAQTVRDDQLDDMKELGVIPSFFSMHTFYWGDWYRKTVLGEKRAARISPAKSALNRGMIYTSHHDAPVALPSSISILASQVTRLTRSNHVLGPAQRVTALDAIKATTINAAYQYHEEGTKGSIEVGKLADFVILSANPLDVPPDQIKKITIVETIKEGTTVYPQDAYTTHAEAPRTARPHRC